MQNAKKHLKMPECVLLISRYNTSFFPGQEYSGYRIYKNTKRNVSIAFPKWW